MQNFLMEEDEKPLAHALDELRCGAPCSFIPQNSLYDLLSKQVIEEELQRVKYQGGDISEDAQTIYEKAKKLFAILVEMGNSGMIHKFLNIGLNDRKLPFSMADIEEFRSTFRSNGFRRTQHDYIAPIWSTNQDGHKDLIPETVLPFLSNKALSKGGFGCTYVVELHTGHQDFFSPPYQKPLQIVRKELRDGDSAETAQDFNRETTILRLLKLLKNARIIPILGSYFYQGKYNLLFPKADLDLRSLLNGPRNPGSLSLRHMDVLLEHLRGLSSAIYDIHHYKLQEKGDSAKKFVGLHHDLKPENILIRNGMLMLADFGLSRLVLMDRGSKTRFKQASGAYVAPECMDENLSSQLVGRSIDVWSFGCLMMDMLIFFQHGRDGVNQFCNERKGCHSLSNYEEELFHAKGTLKGAVISRLQDLRTGDDNIEGFVDLIHETLNVDPETRPDIGKVCSGLAKLEVGALVSRVSIAFGKAKDHDHSEVKEQRRRFSIWGDWANDLGSEEADARCSSVSKKMRELLECIETPSTLDNPKDAVYDLSRSARALTNNLWKELPPAYKERLELEFNARTIESATKPELEMIEAGNDIKMAGMASMRMMRQTMLEGVESDNKPSIEPSQVQDQVPSTDRYLDVRIYRPSSGEEEMVLVEEWNTTMWGLDDTDKKMLGRMESVVALPNKNNDKKELRILSTIGYYFAPKSPRGIFGVVYKLPREDPDDMLPMSLKLVIERNRGMIQLPPLENKYILAYRLCICVAKFHSIHWLHHNLSLKAIMFLVSNMVDENLPIDIRDPYIVGFNHSRPQDGENFSIQKPTRDDPYRKYQHPEYVPGHSRFNRVCDHYSLGVVLLEIGQWREISEEEFNWQDYPHNNLQELASSLKSSMGNKYYDVVMFCLDAEHFNKEEQYAGMFWKQVISPLQDLVNTFGY